MNLINILQLVIQVLGALSALCTSTAVLLSALGPLWAGFRIGAAWFGRFGIDVQWLLGWIKRGYQVFGARFLGVFALLAVCTFSACSLFHPTSASVCVTLADGSDGGTGEGGE